MEEEDKKNSPENTSDAQPAQPEVLHPRIRLQVP